MKTMKFRENLRKIFPTHMLEGPKSLSLYSCTSGRCSRLASGSGGPRRGCTAGHPRDDERSRLRKSAGNERLCASVCGRMGISRRAYSLLDLFRDLHRAQSGSGAQDTLRVSQDDHSEQTALPPGLPSFWFVQLSLQRRV